MSEEEKEAIKVLKDLLEEFEDVEKYAIVNLSKKEFESFQVILNLIEKQQKEIERLKKDKDILYGVIDEKNNDIRVKINELKGLHLDHGDTFDSMRNYAVLILEELLEE